MQANRFFPDLIHPRNDTLPPQTNALQPQVGLTFKHHTTPGIRIRCNLRAGQFAFPGFEQTGIPEEVKPIDIYDLFMSGQLE